MSWNHAIAKLSTLTLSLFAASCGSGSTPTTTAGGGSTSGGASGSGGGGAASGAVGGALGASGASGAVGGALGASGGANGGAGSGGMGVGSAGASGGGVAGNETTGASGGGTGGDSNQTACSSGSAQAGDVTVSLSSLQQKISGFGVSSAWAGSYRNASDADFLWSTSKGAGMSLLRIRYGDGLAIAKSAAASGVKVWMTPWGTGTNGAQGGSYTTTQTNPNGCKTGSMPVLTNPSGLASALVTWVQNAKAQGVPIFAVSAENEPDSCGINSTTSYSAAQLATWIETLGPAMAAIDVEVMGPETQNWYGFPSYFTAIQSNALAYKYVSIFAGHRYGLGPDSNNAAVVAANKAIAADSSKEYWQTEVDTGTANGDASGDGISSALLMAKQMHADLTVANLNAWHLWWVYNASGNGGCLYDTSTNTWTKRLWVMGNFSRFVRPGYTRVSTSGTVPSGVLLTAYKNPADGTVVMVAINNNTNATPLSLFVSGAVPCTVTPWVTSASDSLAAKSPIAVSNARFSASLPAQSVTTFVAKP